jgi:hypothetical protein
MNFVNRALVVSLAFFFVAYSNAQAPEPVAGQVAAGDIASPDQALYLKVKLDSALKTSALKPGDQVQGRLLQDVYSGAYQLFPASSAIRLTVDRLDRRRRVPNDHWPWMINAFTPRHEKYPLFRAATVTAPDGHEIPLRVSTISMNKEVEVSQKAKKKSADSAAQSSSAAATRKPRQEMGPIVTFEANLTGEANGNSTTPFSPEPVTLAAGTEAKVILLRDVSASRDHAGNSFQARLVEPVWLNSKIVIPEGSIFEGKVLSSRGPRMLSRSGSLNLAFTNLIMPGAPSEAIAASVTGAELNQRSHTVIDPEGQMHGDRPGKAWMLLNIGVTAGIAKEVDDGTQLLIEAIVSTATDASTAGTAKIAATCASGIYMLTRHGRDVVLPKFTQMKIMFDRPIEIPAAQLNSKTETLAEKSLAGTE